MKKLMLGVALSMALVGCSDQSAPKRDVRAGQAFAEKECKGCHGLDGKGAAPAIPNLAGQRERYLLTSLKSYKEGSRMHAALRALAGRMTETDAANVAAFYAGLPAIVPAADKRAQVFSPYETGKALAPQCASCHSADGNSKTPGTPSLAGQQPRYFVLAVQEALAGIREGGNTHAVLRTFSQLQLESLALYYASQAPAERSAPPFGNPTLGEPLTASCGGCHGAHGISTDSATPTVAAQDPQYLVNSIKAYGKTRKHDAMQRAVAGLGDKDIENVAAFYAVQKSRAAENGQTIIAEQTEKCNRCHSGEVENPSLAIPNIRGQDKDYLTMALRAYRDEKRGNSLMHNMSMPYTDTIVEGLASFYASRPPK